MSNNALLAVVIGAACYLVVSKQAKAGVTNSSGGRPVVANGRPIATNVNSDMWARLMGNSWTELAAGAASIGRNVLGQAVSSDGKPISAGDPLSFYNQLQAGDAVSLPDFGGYALPDVSGGTLLNWGETSGGSGLSWADLMGLA